jgi:hypothetical protein
MGHFGRQNAHTYEHFIFQNAPSQFFFPPWYHKCIMRELLLEKCIWANWLLIGQMMCLKLMLKSKSRFWMHNEFLRKPNLPNNNSFCKWVIFSSSFVNSMISELLVLDWRLLTNKLYLYIYFCDMFQRWTQEGIYHLHITPTFL